MLFAPSLDVRSAKHLTVVVVGRAVSTMAMSMFSKGFMNWAAKTYQKTLSGELNKMGKFGDENGREGDGKISP